MFLNGGDILTTAGCNWDNILFISICWNDGKAWQFWFIQVTTTSLVRSVKVIKDPGEGYDKEHVDGIVVV